MAAENIVGIWDIDPEHSRIGFQARHAMVSKVRGAFTDVSGTADIRDERYEDVDIKVGVNVSSIDTRNDDRDNHLRSPDFFDVATYPTIEFVGHSVDEVEENNFIVNGTLTIREISRDLSIPLEFTGTAQDPFGNFRAGLEGSRRIDRADFDVRFNVPLDGGGLLVSNKITLEFELSLVKRPDDATGPVFKR